MQVIVIEWPIPNASAPQTVTLQSFRCATACTQGKTTLVPRVHAAGRPHRCGRPGSKPRAHIHRRKRFRFALTWVAYPTVQLNVREYFYPVDLFTCMNRSPSPVQSLMSKNRFKARKYLKKKKIYVRTYRYNQMMRNEANCGKYPWGERAWSSQEDSLLTPLFWTSDDTDTVDREEPKQTRGKIACWIVFTETCSFVHT